jgi:integrase
MPGEIVVAGHQGQPPVPTTRDDVIRADIARGVPHAQIADEWDLTVDVVDYIAQTMRGEQPLGELQQTRYEQLLERFNPDGVDPDERRDPRAAGYHRDRLAEGTRRPYRRYIGMYLDYCALTGRRELPGNRFTAEGFAVWLAERPVVKGKNAGRVGLSPSSINVALAAVGAFHRACGENPPDRTLAQVIIDGHRKRRVKDRVPDGVGSPAVDLPTFGELVGACDPNTNAGLRDRAMLTLGLNIMARRSELCILDLDDLKLQRGGQWLEVHVAHTKTGKPRDPKVPAWPQMPELCPIRAWTAWRDRLREAGVTEGPAFRAVDRWDNIQGAGRWAGRTELGSRLDGSTLEHIVLRAALKAAIPNADELSPHGVLRRTGATQAYNAGADILAIARQGGWGERSPVVFRYIADIDQYKRNPMLLIGQDEGK